MDQSKPMRRWPRSHVRVRFLGITLLILSLLHAPWPQADFHNVRHQDQAGQVCEYHDHLLRWHPDAGQADDVAVLHWHWILPTPSPLDTDHSGDGPALHADIGDWAVTPADEAPVLVPDRSARSLELPAPCPLAIEASPFLLAVDRPGLRQGLGTFRTFGATFAPRISLASRLQRWSC